MDVIKVSATDSTNSYLRERISDFSHGTICAVTENQENGRGQMGTKWQSEQGKNLTFSVLFKELRLPAKCQFRLGMAVSLVLLQVLKDLQVENPSIKWPNDILAGNKKIAGILIENILKGDKIGASIIGIGLNVNQESFVGLPNAVSLKMLSGKTHDLETILNKILFSLESTIEKIHEFPGGELYQKYHRNLFGIHQKHLFELPNGMRFQGKIQGVDDSGKLLVLDENLQQKSFRLKEVKMIY